MATPVAFSLTVGGRRLAGLDWPGAGRPVICVHGLTGNAANFAALADELSPHHRVIACDLAGAGHSGPSSSDSSIFRHAEDLIGLVGALGLAEARPILLGHSMGAFIAAIAAARAPRFAALAMLDGGGRATAVQGEMVQPALRRLRRDHPSRDAYLQRSRLIFEALGVPWNGYMQGCVEREMAETAEGRWRFGHPVEPLEADLRSIIEDYDPALCAKVRAPLFIGHAAGPLGPVAFYEAVAWDEVRAVRPDASFASLPCNHYTMVVQRQPELAARLRAFWDGA